jgi:sec-independent protein translocase protein TatC
VAVSLSIKGRPIRFSLKWLKPPPSPPDGSMSLFEHLRELRYRLVIASLAIILGMIVCGFFYPALFDLLTKPYYAGITDLKANRPEAITALVSNGLSSPFTVALKICMVAGMVLTSPVWLYQLWAFVVPGLLAKEKKWALIFIGLAAPLFAAGVLVAYVVLPKAIAVLLNFTQSGVTNLQDINLYLSFLLRLMVVFGIAFLIPLLVVMLNFLGVVKATQLRKYRTYVIFGTFVFGAVATPSTDPFSMLALAVPMTLLFMAAEVVTHLHDRRAARRLALAGPDSVTHSIQGDQALRELADPDDPDDRT